VKGIPDPTGPSAHSEVLEAAAGRLREALSILDAVDRGALLAELPRAAEAAARHQCAVSLLAVLRRELAALAGELESASHVHHLIGRLSRSDHAD
jgi:hypothetical protein